MAASKSQGSYFGVFLVGGTLLCVGIACIASATGKVLLVAGAAILLASAVGFLRIKHLEGETPLLPTPEMMKWLGAGVAVLGWLITLGGLRMVESNGGRIVAALLGIGVSLFGIVYVLPSVFNKTAFWKKPAATSARPGFTSVPGRASVDDAAPSMMGAAK